MKKRAPIIIAVVVFLAGVGILAYPKVSDFISRYTSNVHINSYVQQVVSMDETERNEELEAANEYNAALARGDAGVYETQADTGDVTIDPSWLERVDMLRDDAMIGYIKIPKIDVYLPIYQGTSSEILEDGVGHLKNTSLPVGGTSTHAVLSGHTGLPTADLLTDLDQMQVGDVFYLYVMGEALAYTVDQIKIVLPEDTEDLGIVYGQDYVTLVTCTPYGINSHRLLVRGIRTEYTAQDDEVQAMQYKSVQSQLAVIPGYAFAIAAAVWFLIKALFRRLNRI